MRIGSRLLQAVIIGMTIASHALLANAPADTVRPGQCSPRDLSEVDTTAAWFRTWRTGVSESPDSWSNDSLRTELIALARIDQAVRREITPESLKDSAVRHRIAAADSTNTDSMRVILARYGWPGKSMVGARGTAAAFLLVQHSLELGPQGLTLMLAAKPGDVIQSDLALVLDRQNSANGQPQVYGSQVDPLENGMYSFSPIQDIAHVDERRARAGLPPLRDYACIVATMYSTPVVLPER